MSARKERLTVTVDAELIAAGDAAVRGGRAPSLSAWVNRALTEHVARETRRASLAAAIAAYEREHGVITPDEIAAQARADARAARVVRGPEPAHKPRPKRRKFG